MCLSSSFRPGSQGVDAFVVHPWISSRTRRAAEFCCAAVALAACLPLLLMIAIAVRCTSRGSVFFRQRRLGRNGREFTLLKFRSMVTSREVGALITVSGDRRITRVGVFLRRYKLDELPQFWNVLLGDMSLVGPRPKLPQHEALTLSARPGITGPATVLFRDEERLLAELPADHVEAMYDSCIKPEKARLDAAYLRNATFLSDCRLLAATVAACLRPEASAHALREHLKSFAQELAPVGGRPATVAARQHEGSPARSQAENRPAIAWQASLFLLVLLIPLSANAQQTAPSPAASGADSRFDFFAGYSYWATQGSVENQPFLGSDQGINVNASWFFRRYIGVQLDGKYFYNESNNSLSSISAGPVFRIPTTHGFTPFIHVLMGAADIEGPLVPVYPGIAGPSSATWGPQFTVGEGLDYELPWLHHRFAVRLGQADYMYDQVKFSNGFSANLNSLTLSTGLVVHFGGAVQAPPNLRCSAFPKVAYAGEPVTVSSMASGLDPKRTAVYHWASPNFSVSGSAPGLEVDTSGLHPGTYTIVVQVSQGSQAKQSARCTTGFAIQKPGAHP